MIGDITPERGKRKHGWLHIGRYPSGQVHALPLMVYKGQLEGPTLVLTANIHGNETTGIAVLHELFASLDQMSGQVIAIPTLNPGGLQMGTRTPYFDVQDPNRLFPAKEEKAQWTDTLAELSHRSQPTLQEKTNRRVYELIREHAHAYVDLHCATPGSVPLSYIDAAFFDDDAGEAQGIFNRMHRYARCMGLPIVCDTPGKEYFTYRMAKSSTGSAFNDLRIPAFTAELGSCGRMDESIIPLAVEGIKNVMKEMGMLTGEQKKIDYGFTFPDTIFRFISHPRAPDAGIIRYLKKEGDFIRKGETLCALTDIYGVPVGDGRIISEVDGYVFWLTEKQAVFPGERLCMMAVPFEGSLVVPLPK